MIKIFILIPDNEAGFINKQFYYPIDNPPTIDKEFTREQWHEFVVPYADLAVYDPERLIESNLRIFIYYNTTLLFDGYIDIEVAYSDDITIFSAISWGGVLNKVKLGIKEDTVYGGDESRRVINERARWVDEKNLADYDELTELADYIEHVFPSVYDNLSDIEKIGLEKKFIYSSRVHIDNLAWAVSENHIPALWHEEKPGYYRRFDEDSSRGGFLKGINIDDVIINILMQVNDDYSIIDIGTIDVGTLIPFPRILILEQLFTGGGFVDSILSGEVLFIGYPKFVVEGEVQRIQFNGLLGFNKTFSVDYTFNYGAIWEGIVRDVYLRKTTHHMYFFNGRDRVVGVNLYHCTGWKNKRVLNGRISYYNAVWGLSYELCVFDKETHSIAHVTSDSEDWEGEVVHKQLLIEFGYLRIEGGRHIQRNIPFDPDSVGVDGSLPEDYSIHTTIGIIPQSHNEFDEEGTYYNFSDNRIWIKGALNKVFFEVEDKSAGDLLKEICIITDSVIIEKNQAISIIPRLTALENRGVWNPRIINKGAQYISRFRSEDSFPTYSQNLVKNEHYKTLLKDYYFKLFSEQEIGLRLQVMMEDVLDLNPQEQVTFRNDNYLIEKININIDVAEVVMWKVKGSGL